MAADYDVHPVTPDRFEDLASLLRPKQPGASACWCTAYRSPDRAAKSGHEREEYMRGLCEREHAPGVLAYDGGLPVGWCSVSPREEFSRIVHSRTIPAVDERPAWSVTCFVVRTGHRRKGVAGALLAGAVAYARSCGAQRVEGYPLDAQGAKISAAFVYVGTVGMFEREGFTRAAPTTSTHGGIPRVVMRRELGSA
jgi:GNAT superfamily N-acetyltransferase